MCVSVCVSIPPLGEVIQPNIPEQPAYMVAGGTRNKDPSQHTHTHAAQAAHTVSGAISYSLTHSSTATSTSVRANPNKPNPQNGRS
mmetsp:Transcript_28188/g.81222  ORF Transcript_28188/g.81222 Transcript_28188/m.81222 type:complete len:86 (+) Transcript_28188:2735-2992(+)